MRRGMLPALVAGLVMISSGMVGAAGGSSAAQAAAGGSRASAPFEDTGLATGWTASEPAGFNALATVDCDGDGSSGKRVQMLYVRETAQADRLATFRSSFQQWAADTDKAFLDSAQVTGGFRHVRWVHDASCVPTVTGVVVANGTLADFNRTFTALKNAGYNRTDRKYVAYAETTAWCGLGGGGPGANDDRPGPENRYNSGPELATVGSGCWGWAPSAHELLHTLGAVLPGAPHATRFGHCWDDEDIMCYNDGGIPNPPGALVKVCAGAPENTIDCKNDDYFSTRPAAGSWLASHWNVANSQYLRTFPAWSTIIDNTSASFSASANWGSSAFSAQRYGTNYRFANPQAISDPAWYSATLPAAASYRVEAWYPADPGYNNVTPYVVVTSSGNQTVNVNQRLNGGKWVNLGTFAMTAGAHNVVGVSRWTAGTGYVIADAVRITRVS